MISRHQASIWLVAQQELVNRPSKSATSHHGCDSNELSHRLIKRFFHNMISNYKSINRCWQTRVKIKQWFKSAQCTYTETFSAACFCFSSQWLRALFLASKVRALGHICCDSAYHLHKLLIQCTEKLSHSASGKDQLKGTNLRWWGLPSEREKGPIIYCVARKGRELYF